MGSIYLCSNSLLLLYKNIFHGKASTEGWLNTILKFCMVLILTKNLKNLNKY